MWIIAMFDLPTHTKKQRKDHTKFRKLLLQDGFSMLQFSVYARHCPSREHADVHLRRIGAQLPPAGEVRILLVSDKQYSNTMVFVGKRERAVEPRPSQLELF